MTKKKNKSARRTPPVRAKETQVKEESSRGRAARVLLGFATLLGIPAFVLMVLPRVYVPTPSGPVDPNNVLSVSSEISNTGYVPLNDVSASMVAGEIHGPEGGASMVGKLKPNGAPAFNIHFPIQKNQHHYLGLDGKFTINPENQLSGAIESADIAIVVSYEPWFIPIKREKMFRFVAKKDARGRIYWRSWPIDEPAPVDKVN
jgi:hypothetical protein